MEGRAYRAGHGASTPRRGAATLWRVRTLNVLLLVVLLAGGLWAWLGTRPTAPPAPDEEGAAPRDGTEAPLPPAPVTGSLVVRVRTSDGSPLPAGTQAGYTRFGSPRLRSAAPDGTFPFSDAPTGRIEVTAQAPGWTVEDVTVTLVPGVPAEAVVTLTPAPK
jgi:hypothetical protein